MTSHGYLYFDLNRGCTSPMLISAMASLGITADTFNDGFKKAGLGDINVVIEKVEKNSLKCQAAYFYCGEQLITAKETTRSVVESNAPFKPKWKMPLVDGMTLMSPIVAFDKISPCAFINRCFGPDRVSFKEIEEFVRNTKNSPDVVGLALHMINNVKSELFVEKTLSGDEALWFTVHLLALSMGLRALDPGFVQASKIVTSTTIQETGFKDSTWLYETLRGLPVVDIKASSMSLDVLAVAFLKTVVSHFGERGEGTIKRIGIGSETSFGNHAQSMTVLFCEKVMPSTMAEGSKEDSFLSPELMYEASALVPVHAPLMLLTEALLGLSAKELHQLLVHRENESLFSIRFIIGEEQKEAALKALFTIGHAQHVTMKQTAMYALTERLVAAPVGSGNKQTSVRFMEYLLGEEIVKAVPVEEDLVSYMHQSDLSMDVARRDLLEAWKKWRKA